MTGYFARLRATVRLDPKGSQVVLLSLIVVMAVCFVSAFVFAWHEVNFWLPATIGLLLLVVVVWFWLRSQGDVDYATLPPVELLSRDGERSTLISFHPNSPPTGQMLEVLERVASLRHSKPLPKPDGLLDEAGHPVAGSQEEASRRVGVANEEVRRAVATLEMWLGRQGDMPAVEQPQLDVEPAREELEGNRPDVSESG